jgi:hypothetical protein
MAAAAPTSATESGEAQAWGTAATPHDAARIRVLQRPLIGYVRLELNIAVDCVTGGSLVE